MGLDRVAVLGPGRIGRQIALTFALGGWPVALVDLKDRTADAAAAVFADARREIARDLRLMAEEGVISAGEIPPALARLEDRRGLDGLGGCGFVQEALPELVDLKREALARVSARVAPEAIIASTSSTISPGHLVEAIEGGERFLGVHWLNPAHIIPLVEVVPGRSTDAGVVQRTIALLEKLGKTPVRCADSPGFIGPRMQALPMNEAVRLVEEGVATPEDVDRAFKAGMGFRYATVGIFEFIDWGGVDILHGARRSGGGRCERCSDSSGAPGAPDVLYFRATDPFPLESADHTKLHEFYTRLAAGRLATTRCAAGGRLAWPTRGFCGECASDRFDWADLSGRGTIHAFTVQEAGLPAGFDGPRVFAIVKKEGLGIFLTPVSP